jgi:hypothetical protein
MRRNPRPATAHLNSALGIPGPGRPKGSKAKLTAARVEEEIRRIATFDPVTLFERFRDPTTGKVRRVFTLRKIHAMDPETRACIASVKVRTENLTSGDDAQDQTVEIKLWNKLDALALCAKHFGWVTDKHEVTVHLDELLARLDRGRQRNALVHKTLKTRQTGIAPSRVQRWHDVST